MVQVDFAFGSGELFDSCEVVFQTIMEVLVS